MNFTYDPNEFEILMDMNMNENSIYANSISGKNPPPVCLPVPTGPLPLGLDMCVKLFNIFTPGLNLHLCLDLMARVQESPIMVKKCLMINQRVLMNELCFIYLRYFISIVCVLEEMNGCC